MNLTLSQFRAARSRESLHHALHPSIPLHLLHLCLGNESAEDPQLVAVSGQEDMHSCKVCRPFWRESWRATSASAGAFTIVVGRRFRIPLAQLRFRLRP
jgi:hypothetical protein